MKSGQFIAVETASMIGSDDSAQSRHKDPRMNMRLSTCDIEDWDFEYATFESRKSHIENLKIRICDLRLMLT